MDENFVVSLINPFYNVKGKRPQENSIIKLPPLNPPLIAENKDLKAHWAKRFENYVFKSTISADPILDAKDCIVALIYFPLCQLAFIRPHSDKAWTYIDGVTYEHYMDSDIRNMHDIVYFKNKFYALDVDNGLFSFEADKFKSKDDFICVINRNQQLGDCGRGTRYLVESSDHGELLMIHRYYASKGKRRSRATYEFKVFKLDDDKRNWIEINTLGDAAIFLGDNSPVYIATSANFGYITNCIYFTHDEDRLFTRILPRDNGVYNIETGIVSQIDTQAKALVKMSKKTPIWTNIRF